MKRIFYVLTTALLCLFFSGLALASEHYDRNREDKIYGVIEKMPENGFTGTWIVKGREVIVSNSTRIKEKYGRAVPGQYVEVEGRRNGNNFTAYEIEVEENREYRSDSRSSTRGYYDRNSEDKIYGVIEKMPENGFTGIWIVKGREVIVSDTTRIKEKYGRTGLGKYVEVEGRRNGNSFTAYEIEVEENREYRSDSRRSGSKFYGVVEGLPEAGLDGTWLVNGREVLVTPRTQIKQKYNRVAIGSYVEVEGNYSDNTFTAYEIEMKNRRR